MSVVTYRHGIGNCAGYSVDVKTAETEAVETFVLTQHANRLKN
jgi:hypothetical protein